MQPSLSELKVLPSFCFAFKIPDHRAVTNTYVGENWSLVNPIPTIKKSYIKDHPRAESALVYMKSTLGLSLYDSDVPGGVVVSTTDL